MIYSKTQTFLKVWVSANFTKFVLKKEALKTTEFLAYIFKI